MKNPLMIALIGIGLMLAAAPALAGSGNTDLRP